MTEDHWLVLDEYEKNQFELIAMYASRAAAMAKASTLYGTARGTVHVRVVPGYQLGARPEESQKETDK